MYDELIAAKPAPRPPSPKTPQAKDPRHKLPDRLPSLEMPVTIDHPAASERSATSEQSGFWTPNSGSGLSSDCGYATSSLPYPESVGGYSATPSESNFAPQSDVGYTPSTPQTPHVGFIDNAMLQMAPPPVAGYNAGVPAEGLMFNADSFRHPPPQFEAAQSYESPRAAQNFDRSYKAPRSGYEHYDRSFQRKDCGRERRDNRWEWNERRDRSRQGGKDGGSYHSHHKGAERDRKHNRDRHRGRNKDWNNGRNRDWDNGSEWDEGRPWDSGGRRNDWESEVNSQDNNWSKDGNEQQYVQQQLAQMTPQQLAQMTPQQLAPQQLAPAVQQLAVAPPQQLQPQIPAPLPAPVSLLPPVCMSSVPPPMSTPLLPPMPDITTAPPPLPQAVVALQPQTSPDIDSRRSTSLEARIQSLLRQNSEFDDAGSDDTNIPDEDVPPLPPTTEEVAPPPLPPEPEESAPPLPEESAPPLPAGSDDDEAVCDIPSNGMLSTGEMLPTFHTWATSDFVHEESVEVGADRTPVAVGADRTPIAVGDPVNVTEVTSADIAADVAVVSDDDDRMSLSSLSSGEEKLEVTAPPPPGVMQQQQLPGGAFASPTLLPTWDKLYMQNVYAMQATMLSPSYLNARTVDHEYEETEMFSGVLERVIAELRVIMTKDLSKKMVETSAFKSFEGWWDGEKNRHKVGATLPLYNLPPGFLRRNPLPKLYPQTPAILGHAGLMWWVRLSLRLV